MVLFGNRVVIERKATKKKSAIIHKDAETLRVIEDKVIQLGTKMKEGSEVAIGQIPVYGNHVDFSKAKFVSGDPTTNVYIQHIIIHAEDIIGYEELGESIPPVIQQKN